ncbi:MAG: MATE family efflux transporter [Lachnospiraceae bacterium]
MDFIHHFLSLAIALILQNIVTLSVNLTDNIMLGSYSEAALAGAASVNQIQFLYQQLLLALADALVIPGSQYWGKKQVLPIKRITAAAVWTAFFISFLLFVFTGAFPHEILGIFTGDAVIMEEGVSYLKIVRFSHPFFAVTEMLLASFRSIKKVKIAFRLSVASFFINIIGNYVFIFGHFGIPSMGAAGAAVSTLIVRTAECLIMIVYSLYGDDILEIRAKDLFSYDFRLIKDYLKIAFPLLLVQGLWGISTGLQTVILGHMKANAIAANSVAGTLYLVVKSMATGSASAAALIIGSAIGSGNIRQAEKYAVRLQKIFIVTGMLAGMILFFIRIPVLGLYDLSEDTCRMADHFLMILSIVCVGMSYQLSSNWGIIRGGGNTSFGVRMDIISTWFIVLPLSFYAAFIAKASPEVVVCCLNSDQIFKCIPVFLEIRYGQWMKHLTRE